MFNELNTQQKEAVYNTITNNSLVIAGAGSGKTKVLINRIQYLLYQNTNSSSIMAITFTRKAANELKQRLSKEVDKDTVSDIWVGTFHSICLRILDVFGENLGLSKGYTVLDKYNSKKCAADVLSKMNLEADADTVNKYLSKVNKLKNNIVTCKQYREEINNKYKGKEDSYQQRQEYLFSEFYSKYQQENLNNNVLDYDDIILYTILLLLTDTDTQKFVKNKFKYVLADEVQDSNPANIFLLSLLSKNCNLFMVGDEDQSIYGFRGARPDLLMDYVKKNNINVLKLEQNYRSTKVIVDASNVVIANNKNRINKVCFSNNERGQNIIINNSITNTDEAVYISNKIKEYINIGYSYEDIMILYRTNAQSRVFEETFLKQGVPYTLIGSLAFTDRAEIKDCLSALKLVCNNKDKYSFKRVLNTLDGIGKKTQDDILMYMGQYGNALNALLEYSPKTKKARESINLLVSILSTSESNYDVAINKISQYYIDKLSLLDNEINTNKIDNMKELQKLVTEKKQSGLTLQEFVNYMDLISSNDKETDNNSVSMLTVHCSKGLESKIVFMVGVNEGIFPHKNSSKTPEEVEEERRLFYVAMTRAKKLLCISYYNQDFRNIYNESRFISEIPNEYIAYDDEVFCLNQG